MDTETFYLVELPGGDRRFIWRYMTTEKSAELKKSKPGTRIYKVLVQLPPSVDKPFDDTLFTATAQEE